jgi:predicted metal-dependent phosphoesterase TrpH
MKSADLHLHTVYSDGTFTPARLIAESKKAGLSCIAVVDHDTVEGIAQSIDAARPEDIEVLPGIELTAELEGKEVHILGYLIDYNSKALINKLQELKRIRVERVHKIVEKLKESGIDIDPELIFELAQDGTVGRLHIARALVKDGLVSNVYEAFQKYIGDRGPAYVCGFRFNPKEAVKFIKDAGGIPVLAHPYSLNNDDLILQFIEYGIMGLEIHYPEHSQSMVNYYFGIAKKHGLLVTGGSDCHGDAKPDVLIGCIKIPYELVERLKEAKKEIQ